MVRTKKFAALAIASALTLAACSDDSDASLEGKQSGNASSSEETPDGTEESGDENGETGEDDPAGQDASGNEGSNDGADDDANTGGSASDIDAAPATGPQAQHADYTLTLPEGWEEFPEGQMPEEFEVVAADGAASGDFANNINVLSATTQGLSIDEVEEAAAAELEQVGATDVKVRDRIIVDGGDVVRISARMTQQGEYDIEQFYLTNGDMAKIATVSTAPDVSEDEREALALSIMTTWSWN